MSTTTTQLLPLRQQRNDQIRADYKRLYGLGKRNEVILGELSAKYYLQLETIERIVFERGAYRPKEVASQGDNNH